MPPYQAGGTAGAPPVDPASARMPTTSTWSAQMQMWYYVDTSNNVQGPFPATSMQSWFEQKYLYSELLIRPEEDSTFRPLHVYMKESGDPNRFFLVPPVRLSRSNSVCATPTDIGGSAGITPSPHVSATSSPQLAAMQATSLARSTAPDPAAQGGPASASTAPSSNLSADDILTALRVMSQLQLLMPNSSEAQTLQMMQSVLSTSVPHANEAGRQDILQAMQQQAENDAARASQARAYADAAPSPAQLRQQATTSSDKDTHWPYTHDPSLYSDDEDDPFSPEPRVIPPSSSEPEAPQARQVPQDTITKAEAEEMSAQTAQAEPQAPEPQSSAETKAAPPAPAQAQQTDAPVDTEPTPLSATNETEHERLTDVPDRAARSKANTTSSQSQPARKGAGSVRPAPWAPTSGKAPQSSTPNMRKILEAEQRERRAQEAKERANNSAMLVNAMAMLHVTSDGSAGGASRSSGGGAWNVTKAAPAKSLSEIQQEESARAASRQAAQAARPSAYSNSAIRGASAHDASVSAPVLSDNVAGDADSDGWVKIGAGGKGQHPLPTKPAAPKTSTPKPPMLGNVANRTSVSNKPPATHSQSATVASPMSSVGGGSATSQADEDGWVTMKPKHQVRRDALSQMNESIPRPTGTAAGVAMSASSRPTTVPTTPQPPSSEFLKHCRDQLKGLRANIDDFIEMLLSFPLNPSPEVSDIIAEAVYANSSTLDGRRFAADFIARRKADAFRAVTL